MATYFGMPFYGKKNGKKNGILENGKKNGSLENGNKIVKKNGNKNGTIENGKKNGKKNGTLQNGNKKWYKKQCQVLIQFQGTVQFTSHYSCIYLFYPAWKDNSKQTHRM